tara:strand:+ start:5787 stop:6731 length:945 start_codon:yes stop_codon:yes gene_type:complete
MAEAIDTLAGLVQMNDQNLADLDMSDLLDDAPLLKFLLAVGASNGTDHKYLKQTVASSNAFRAVGAGLTKTPSQDQLVTDTLKILDGSFSVDKALADAYTKGGAEAFMARELKRTMKQRMFEAESQVINGVNNDAGGFIGLRDDTQLDALADEMVVQAATPGAGVNLQSSVYFLREGIDDVAVIAGNDGRFDVAEEATIIEKVVNPGTDNKVFPAYYIAICGYLGFQIGAARSAARLCNIQGTLTDDDLYEALALFPSARQANVIAMNRGSLKALRASRTAVNPTGSPAPMPTNLDGIPIIVTDSITQIEAVVA